MSEEKLPEPITLNWVGVRLLQVNAELRDLQQRFTAIEARLGALETRFAVQENRMTAMLDLLVRVAERVGATQEGQR